MSPLAEEIARVADSLPTDKAKALVEYAQYLADRADSEEWDRKFTDPKYAPKLKAFMAEVECQVAQQIQAPAQAAHRRDACATDSLES